MVISDELKALLADKYDQKVEDLTDTTPLNEVVNNNKLAGYLKEKFNIELSADELEDVDTIASLADLLRKA
ncbi:hypothetical protein [Pseudomonas sp. RC3H12]|uniref:acyl carrier protein n=1 Tax=Pseudomonas sp. RC3H12 TaxID=2834406 RepID=UPI001BDDE6D6|nr:hypothetical protein [Pseudomonas sp. RC3H12]QWA30305.1 hypothetical protein KHO27_05330 [Pseudomonas sp. RC3H12]